MRLFDIFVAGCLVVFAIYGYWLFSMIDELSSWPTPHYMLIVFAPLPFFLLVGFASRFIHRPPLMNAILILVGVVFAHLTQRPDVPIEVDSQEKYEAATETVMSDQNEKLCDVHFRPVQKRNAKRSGACSFQLFPDNNAKVGKFSTRTDANGCIEAIHYACENFCGNLTEPGTNQVDGLLVNFGPKENFDEFHLPYSSTQTFAVISCDRVMKAKRRATAKVIDAPSF